jgi:hypothetical protein
VSRAFWLEYAPFTVLSGEKPSPGEPHGRRPRRPRGMTTCRGYTQPLNLEAAANPRLCRRRHARGTRRFDEFPCAAVFAGGMVGIVNDFDGVFQHVNLEAGEHHIEIESPGFEPVAFDVLVQPGRTITFRADMDRY